MNIVYGRNSVYQTTYHVVLCPKYRKFILKGKVAIAENKLKEKLSKGSLWSPSYYVGTAGNVSAETIQNYIERTEHIKCRR
jgi:putative transposase